MTTFSSTAFGKIHAGATTLVAALVCMPLVLLCSCSEDKAPPVSKDVSSAPDTAEKSGIKIVEHSVLPQTSDPLRTILSPPTGEGSAATPGIQTSQPPPELQISEAQSPQPMRRADGPQTPPMRLEARQHAMAEMLRIRKAAETQAPPKSK
jgi:hypothetical protein